MYSPSLKKFVFVDFGVSRIIREDRGEKTMTEYFGTPDYSSEEMRNLKILKKEG